MVVVVQVTTICIQDVCIFFWEMSTTPVYEILRFMKRHSQISTQHLRSSYLVHCLPLPSSHNSWVPPCLHFAPGLCSIVLLPDSSLAEHCPYVVGPETQHCATKSTPDLATVCDTQWVQSQLPHWYLHGSVTWKQEHTMEAGRHEQKWWRCCW